MISVRVDAEQAFWCNAWFPGYQDNRLRALYSTQHGRLREEAHLFGITMKRTYQASKVRRARTHGFLVRMKSRGGRAVINARRAKGRKRLAV